MKVFAAFQSLTFLRSLSTNSSPSPHACHCQHLTALYQTSTMTAENCENNTTIPAQTSVSAQQDPPALISSTLPPLTSGSRRIYLLRHGETDWNKLGKIQGGGYDIPLNENGKIQALSTALALEDVPLGVVVSSHLGRAKETADILWGRHHSTVQDRRVVLAGLAEMSFGEFEGLAWRDQDCDPAVKKRFKSVSQTIKENIDIAFPGGGESTKDVQERCTEALQHVLTKYSEDQHIAIVSHGRTNKVLIAATAMRDVMEYPTIEQGNTCINVMDVDENGNWTIQTLNYIDHVKDNVIVR